MLKKEKGVTLLELMVAVVITALLGVALSTIFKTYTAASQKGEARTQRYQNARLALDRIATELRGALVPDDHEPTGESNYRKIKFYGRSDTYIYEGTTYDKDILDFITSLPNSGDSPRCERAYQLDTTNHDLLLNVITAPKPDYTEFTYPNPPTSSDGLQSPLAAHVIGFNCRYYKDGSGWQDTWQGYSGGAEEGTLPGKIEIKVTVQSQLSRYKKTDTISTLVVLHN